MTVQNVLLFGNNASERFVLSNKALICRVFINNTERMTETALGFGVGYVRYSNITRPQIFIVSLGVRLKSLAFSLATISNSISCESMKVIIPPLRPMSGLISPTISRMRSSVFLWARSYYLTTSLFLFLKSSTQPSSDFSNQTQSLPRLNIFNSPTGIDGLLDHCIKSVSASL